MVLSRHYTPTFPNHSHTSTDFRLNLNHKFLSTQKKKRGKKTSTHQPNWGKWAWGRKMTTAATATISASAAAVPPFSASLRHSNRLSRSFLSTKPLTAPSLACLSPLYVTNESSRTEVSTSPDADQSDANKIVDGMDFGELCNDFECISSPLVESTARQLARDILELREGNRAIGTYAVSVKYKDPIRSFTGREKYKRPLWATDALDKPSVIVQEMTMLSTSVLNIKWKIKGRPKSLLASIGGDLIIKVDSKFTLNQISGQVIEHMETWDLSSSSPIAQAYFWASRGLFSAIEAGKDVAESAKSLSSRLLTPKENLDVYPDPTGDPTKFFQRDDGFQRDLYQIALFLAIVYFVVQFLRTTL